MVCLHNGEVLNNTNASVAISDIGEGSASILCITDKNDCCRSPHGTTVGEWYFPNNESAVGIKGGGGSFYRDRGASVVCLHRRHNATMPTGLFCCVVPDANGTNQRICVMVEAINDTSYYNGIIG